MRIDIVLLSMRIVGTVIIIVLCMYVMSCSAAHVARLVLCPGKGTVPLAECRADYPWYK